MINEGRIIFGVADETNPGKPYVRTDRGRVEFENEHDASKFISLQARASLSAFMDEHAHFPRDVDSCHGSLVPCHVSDPNDIPF